MGYYIPTIQTPKKDGHALPAETAQPPNTTTETKPGIASIA